MTGRRAGVALLGILGLALLLWPALRGPVVLWADGQTDLRWAREGVGLWKPFSDAEARAAPVHTVKPGYLLFLRAASAAFPSLDEGRSVLLVQSILLWAAVAGVSVALARRYGAVAGACVYGVLLLLPPLRYAASSVMPEALSAALFLPLAAAALWTSPTRGTVVACGLVLVALFWVRPNAAGFAILLLCVAWGARRDFRALGGAALIFLAATAGAWLITRPYAGSDRARGLPDAILFGSGEYAWGPAVGPWAPRTSGFDGDSRLDVARENWTRALEAPVADVRRDLAWRAVHGILGLEYSDTRWAPALRGFDHAARIAFPVAALAALATALTAPARPLRLCAAAIIAGLVVQSVAIGALPRYAAPIFPVVGMIAVSAVFLEGRARLARTAIVAFLLLAASLAALPHLASWDWGQIEAQGVVLEQRIPRNALPRQAPATLHVRVASPVPAADAGLDVSVDGRLLYRSADDADRSRAFISMPLPPEVLEENSRRTITLRLTATGGYGPFSYLLFAVVPPPRGGGAIRLGSRALSPRSDVEIGALDWWAHRGGP